MIKVIIEFILSKPKLKIERANDKKRKVYMKYIKLKYGRDWNEFTIWLYKFKASIVKLFKSGYIRR